MDILRAMDDRVLLLDGGMGTSLQQRAHNGRTKSNFGVGNNNV